MCYDPAYIDLPLSLTELSNRCKHAPSNLLLPVLHECSNATKASVQCTTSVYNFLQNSNFSSYAVACIEDAAVKNSTNPLGSISNPAGVYLVLSALLDSGNCTQFRPSQLGQVVQMCSNDCDYEAYLCSRNTECSDYVIPNPTLTGPAQVNLTAMLKVSNSAVQMACANETQSGLSFPTHSRLEMQCGEQLNECMINSNCSDCLSVYKLVNAGSVTSVHAFLSCLDPVASNLIQQLFDSCDWFDLATDSGHCLARAWQCVNEPNGWGEECIASLRQYSLQEHIDADDDQYYGVDLKDFGGLPSVWFDLLNGESCVNMIQEVESWDAINGEDDLPQADNSQNMCDRTLWDCDFSTGIFFMYQAMLCYINEECNSCLASEPTAYHVTVRYQPSCKLLLKPLLVANINGYVEYVTCSTNIAVNNQLVVVTSAYGAASTVGSLSVLAVIYGYRKDVRSFRDRILVGVFFGNVIYSCVNMIPVSLESTDDETCGDPVFASFVSLRGMWFWGKFTIIAYEMFIIWASLIALRTGSTRLPLKQEVLAHSACLGIGPIVFVGFYIEGDILNNKVNTASDYRTQQNALGDYNTLVQSFVQAYLVTLIVVLLLWIYQRFVVFARLEAEIKEALVKAENESDHDMYTGRRTEAARVLLGLRQQGFEDLVKPLEPYVLIFIVFGIPSAVMATDRCNENSLPGSPSVNCQHACEMLLTLRTIGTVLVYYLSEETRNQLWHFKLLCNKIWTRFSGQLRYLFCGYRSRKQVGFSDIDDITLIPALEKASSRSLRRADSDIALMGNRSFAVIETLDDQSLKMNDMKETIIDDENNVKYVL